MRLKFTLMEKIEFPKIFDLKLTNFTFLWLLTEVKNYSVLVLGDLNYYKKYLTPMIMKYHDEIYK